MNRPCSVKTTFMIIVSPLPGIYILRQCLSYYSIAVTPWPRQFLFQKQQQVFWRLAYSFRRPVHDHLFWWEADMYANGAIAESFTFRSACSRQRYMLGLAWAFETHLKWHISSKAIPPNPSQTVTLIEDQAFKHESFSFKPPQTGTQLALVSLKLNTSRETLKS